MTTIVPLNKRIEPSTKPTVPIGADSTDSIYLHFKLTIWALNYPCTANTPSAPFHLKNIIFR